MELGGKLFIALFLQLIKLSLANKNMVPVFISEMGKLGTKSCFGRRKSVSRS